MVNLVESPRPKQCSQHGNVESMLRLWKGGERVSNFCRIGLLCIGRDNMKGWDLASLRTRNEEDVLR